MNNIYRAEIIDHYQNPRNFGDLPGADVVVKEANASCGDLIEIALKFQMTNSKLQIKDVKFKSVGCAISTAAASLLTERVKNEKLKMKNLRELTEKDMVEMLGIEVSPTRMKCATLPLRALQKAINQRLVTRDKAVEILKAGGVVIFPTDTVWGMGVAADNPAAVKKFYRIKRREKGKPTAILVSDLAQAEEWGEFNKKNRQLAERYWPGALTLVVRSKLGATVGLRVPDHPVIQELCQRVGGILAGSANFAGEPAPQRRAKIKRELSNQVDLVMPPIAEAMGGEPSTVIDTTVKPWRVIRQGTVVIR